MRIVFLLIGCALTLACGPQELRVDNLDWDTAQDPIYRETAVRHSRPKDSEERYDPQEYDPTLESVFVEADSIAERLVSSVPRDEEFGATYWTTKKRLLAQEYNIDWQSPAELNPQIEYGDYGQRKLSDTEKSMIRRIVIEELDSDNVDLALIERQFSGEVWAWAGKDDDRYQFVLNGHRDTWDMKSFGILEF